MPSIPRLPDFVPLRTAQGGSGRVSAQALSNLSLDANDRVLNAAAEGALVPVAYGPFELPGLLFAKGAIAGDLVLGFIWCVGEIEAIDEVIINDATAPAGVTITNYVGTSLQGVDATLSAAVTAYNDTVRFDVGNGPRGLAYSVIRIPAGQLDGWPIVRARGRGRKCGPLGAYTAVPAYFFADMVQDVDYGLGMTVTGVDAVAAWNNSFLGETTEPRNRAFFVLQKGQKIAPDVLDVMAEYAECWYTFEGDSIKMTPDAPVDLATVNTFDASKIIRETINIKTGDATGLPTEVSVVYTEQVTDKTPWVQTTETQRVAGVQRVPTSIRLEGVYRQIEAANRAIARLARQQNIITASFETLDKGVVYQTGDVVKLSLPLRGIDMSIRVTEVSYAGPGRYRVSGSRYDVNHYPSEIILPGDVGTVPVGAITMMVGDTVPEGWAAYADADSKYIMGAGGTHAVGATGGSATLTYAAGTTNTAGEHIGTETFTVFLNPAAPVSVRGDGIATAQGGHAHTYPSNTVTPSPLRRHNRLAIKTGTDGVSIPMSLHIFGLDGLSAPNMSRHTSLGGRMLVADTANSSAGAANYFTSTPNTNSGAMAHFHTLSGYKTGVDNLISVPSNAGGVDHSHPCGVRIEPNTKRRQLALYSGSSDYDVLPGTIMMWSGSVMSLPANWVLCDGTGSTPDMRDYIVTIAGSTTAAPIGNNTAALSFDTDFVTHTHAQQQYDSFGGQNVTNVHSNSIPHKHTWSTSESWTPPYYALAFIMYAPAA